MLPRAPQFAPLRALLPLAFLAGCALGPDYQRPADGVPARFASPDAPGGAPLSAATPWWEHFNDPALTRLVETARAANPDVARAQAAVATARALVSQAGAGGRPRFDGQAGYTYGRQFPIRQSRPEWIARAGFDAGWELDLWGKHARATEAARAQLEGAEASADAAMLTLLGDVARSYIDLRSAQARIAIVRRSALNRQRELSDVAIRLRAGEGTALERLQAETSLLQADALLPSLESQAQVAANALAVLCGRAPGDLDIPPGPLPAAALPATGLPSDLLRRRPDVRIAERDLAATVARIGSAIADRLPSFSLGGSLTLSAATAAAPVFSLGPSVTVPFLDGGLRAAVVEQRRGQAEEARLAYRAAVLRALQDVEDAVARVRGGGRQLLKLSAAVRAAGRTADTAREIYVLGGVEFLQVLTARQTHDRLLLDQAQVQAAAAVDAVALFKALGGGYAAPAG